MIRSVLGSIQLTDQSVIPSSLQMEMENLPKFARTKLMTVPSSHSIFNVDPSHPYFVRRSKPGKQKTIKKCNFSVCNNKKGRWPKLNNFNTWQHPFWIITIIVKQLEVRSLQLTWINALRISHSHLFGRAWLRTQKFTSNNHHNHNRTSPSSAKDINNINKLGVKSLWHTHTLTRTHTHTLTRIHSKFNENFFSFEL
jgi:hypothetical protein